MSERSGKNKSEERMSCFELICSDIDEKLDGGRIGGTITGYSRVREDFDSSAIVTTIRRSGSGKGVWRRIKRGVARQFESSVLMNLIYRLRRAVLTGMNKTYGVFFVTFGIYASLIYLIKKYALDISDVSYWDLIFGVSSVIVAFPLLFSSRSLVQSLGSSVILHHVLSDACGVTTDKLSAKASKRESEQSWAVIAGIAFGMLTYPISPSTFLIGISLIAFLSLMLTFPETGVLISLVASPFLSLLGHPSIVLAAMTLIAAGGFAIKLLRGKRTAICGPLEVTVGAFALLTVAGGAFTAENSGSVASALLRASVMLIYFLIVNSVKDRKRLKICITLMVASAAAVSFIGVAEYLLGHAAYDWLDSELFAGISGRSTSVFSNPNTLAYYIITVFPLSLAETVLAKERRERVLAGFAAVSMLVCTVLTWSRGAWLGMAVSAFVFLMMLSSRAIAILPIGATILSLASAAAPRSFGARISSMVSMSDSANYYRVRIWNGACDIIKRYFFGGIGIGEDIFGEIYTRVAAPEVWNAMHAHSLWLQIIIELGAPGIIVFALLLFFLLQKSFECVSRGDRKLGVMCGACVCGAVAPMVAGAFDHVLYNNTVLFTFWAVAGLASAAAEIRCSELNEISVGNTSAVNDERSAAATLRLKRN